MQDATQSPSELEFDPVAERFFSQPPPLSESEDDDWQVRPMSSLERIAMLTTVAPLVVSIAVAITLLLCNGP